MTNRLHPEDHVQVDEPNAIGIKVKQVTEALTGTMHIDPDEFSPMTSTSRHASLGYAIAGWLYMLRRQKNTRIQAVASILVLVLALWLQLPPLELAILVLTITIVWMAEFINAAVEAAVNVATTEFHPMAKVGKDVASAAVLLGVVASILIGLLLLAPPLLVRLGWAG
ncbi:diacylglycerol kinase family protein [Anaerolineae bacterium CFX9]|jgi:diacylglycerol kinase (ATP)|nr:diacylglycerol kinase family protein [Anaerolineae bacterium CFX9]